MKIKKPTLRWLILLCGFSLLSISVFTMVEMRSEEFNFWFILLLPVSLLKAFPSASAADAVIHKFWVFLRNPETQERIKVVRHESSLLVMNPGFRVSTHIKQVWSAIKRQPE